MQQKDIITAAHYDMNNSEGERPSEPEQQEQNPFDSLVKCLENQDDPLAYEILFQGRLAAEFIGSGNLLTALESAGILPDTDVGNPFDVMTQPEEHQKWFDEHPDEEARFHQAMEEYNNALRYLYLGTVIGDRFGSSMYPNHEYIISPRQ